MPDDHTLYLRPPVWALLVAVLLGGSFYVYGKTVENVDRTPTTISVMGEGKVQAAPDVAQLSFGMQVLRAQTSQAAMERLSTTMQKVVDAVKAAGIPDKDITTQQLSLNPSYDWTDGGQRLRGYDATQSLSVKVRDMAKTSQVLGAAAAAGANQVGGVQFTIDDPDALQAQARQEAIEYAQEKAVVLAKQLGMKLGRVRSFTEGGGGSPPVFMMRGEAMAVSQDASNPAPPIPQGEQEVQVTVNMTYELH